MENLPCVLKDHIHNIGWITFLYEMLAVLKEPRSTKDFLILRELRTNIKETINLLERLEEKHE